MTKLKTMFRSCAVYIDGDADEAEMADAELEGMMKLAYERPDWYYRAKARHRLGLDKK